MWNQRSLAVARRVVLVPTGDLEVTDGRISRGLEARRGDGPDRRPPS